jgi:beta-mannosidase
MILGVTVSAAFPPRTGDRNWRDSPVISSVMPQYLDSYAGVNWTVSRSDGTLTIPAIVPGDLISDLAASFVLSDPIFELTLLNGVWGDLPWIYSANFSLGSQIEPQPGDEVLLVVESIQMIADVSLNGNYLGYCNDQFLRYNFSVGSFLKSNDNILTLTFNVSTDKRLNEGRIMGASGGWDWGPLSHLTSSPPRVGGNNVADDLSMSRGIARSLYLLRTQANSAAIAMLTPLIHYTGSYPSTVLTDSTAGPFVVEVQAVIRNPNSYSLANVQLLASWVFGSNSSSIVTLPPGESIVTAYLFVPVGTVSLWWTRDIKIGPQPLYAINATLFIGGKQSSSMDSRLVGFKVFTIVTDDDSDPSQLSGIDGSGNLTMRFKLNGANLYVRGADVIPMEWLRGRETASAYTRMIQSAADAQFNIIRVDGIDMIFPDIFYDTCDSLGLLVYHDMQYSQSQPAPAATEMQRDELIYSIRRLAPHPSVAVYDGCNECGGRGIYASFVMTVVAETDPTRPPWPTSPSNGWKNGVDRLTSLPNGNPLVPFDNSEEEEENLGSRLLLPLETEKWRKMNSPPVTFNFPLKPLFESQQSQCSQQQNTDYCDTCFDAPAPPASDAGACCDLCAAASSDACWCAVFYQGKCYFKPKANVSTPVFDEGRVAVWPQGRGPPPKPLPPGPQPPGSREVHGPYSHGSGFPTVDSDGFPSESIPIALPPQLYPSYDIGLKYPSVFTSEFGAVTMSSFESMSPTLLPEHWSLHGGGPPDECVRLSFFLKCTGGNAMSQRNYAVDTLISAYFNNTGNLDEVGEDAFARQLYMSMISQSLIIASEVQTQRSRNSYGLLLWQLNEIWPSGSWGSTEYLTDSSYTFGQTGRWKPLQHLFERYLYTSVFSACSVDGRCFVKNDHALNSYSNIVVKRSLVRASDGEMLAEFNNSFSLSVGAGIIQWFCVDGSVFDSSRTCNVTLSDVAIMNGCKGTGSDCILLINVVNIEGDNQESLSAYAQLLDTPAGLVANSLPLFQDNLVLSVDSNPVYLPDGSLPLYLDFPSSAPAGVTALLVVLTAGSESPGRFSDNSFILVRSSEYTSSWCTGTSSPCAVRIASSPGGTTGPTLSYSSWESPPPAAAELAAKILANCRVQHLGQYVVV